jgi:hypothetical protein
MVRQDLALAAWPRDADDLKPNLTSPEEVLAMVTHELRGHRRRGHPGGHAACGSAGGLSLHAVRRPLNDSARLAWDSFKQRRWRLPSALEVSDGARAIPRLGHDGDIEVAGEINQFCLAPELHRDPLRVAVKASAAGRGHLRGHKLLAVHTS